MMFEMQYGITLNDFSKMFGPIAQYRMQKDLMNPDFLTTNNERNQGQETKAAGRIAAFEIQQTLSKPAYGKANRWKLPDDAV